MATARSTEAQQRGLAKDFSISQEDSTWEESILRNETVLQRVVPWDKLASGGVIEVREMEMMKRFLQYPEAQRRFLEEDGSNYGKLFLNLTGKLSQSDHLQFLLALVDTFLTRDDSFCGIFLRLNELNQFLPFEPFMNHLRRDGGDWFINAKASKIVGLFLVQAPRYGISQEILTSQTRFLVKWISYHLDKNDKPELVDPLLTSLRTILRTQEARTIFDTFHGLQILERFLKSPHHPIVYNAMFCFWLLSYNSELSKEKFTRTFLQTIVETIKNIQREKIIRISIATLRNLAEANRINCVHIIEGGLMKLLPNLILRKWGDEELEGNLTYLDEVLQQVMGELGSWEKYKAEILSGNLEWSMVHKNDRFWRENASRFAENNFQVVGVLINLIMKSENSIVLAVALNDIGRFVRSHPAGRNVVQSLPDAKLAVMAKLNHRDPEVQKEALLAIQKLMVSNWEFLSN